MALKTEHLYWFVGGLVLSFAVPALFGNVLRQPATEKLEDTYLAWSLPWGK